MKLSLGIVGLPNVGKSTLFKALTKIDITIANYPFATIDPNVGIVAVPDERVDKLYEMFKIKKPASAKGFGEARKIPAVVEFYDIAGLVKGASSGEGLGNQFLSNIRETQAIVHVVRCFGEGDIIHVESSVDPIRDIDTINTELQLKDLETVDKRLHSAERELKAGDKNASAILEALKIAKEKLSKGELLRPSTSSGQADLNYNRVIKELQLLTAKEILFLLNGSESDIKDDLKQKIKDLGYSYVVVDLSKKDLDLSPVIRKAYDILDLISFFTTGEDETRAWTIKRGTKAPEAAGVIHTDFEKKFIRAEVVPYEKLMEAHSTGSGQVNAWTAAKQKGWMRLEGKEYVVQDGDVLEIRHG